jgi:6-pyruvoyl-tetrahydropterin synthase
LDFTKLKDFVEDHILDYLDHHDLNEVVDMNGIADMGNPTAENILLWIYYRLVPKVDSLGRLYSLELKEGRDTKVTLLRDRVGYTGGANND